MLTIIRRHWRVWPGQSRCLTQVLEGKSGCGREQMARSRAGMGAVRKQVQQERRVLVTRTAGGRAEKEMSYIQPHRPQPSRLLCPWDSPGKNTGVGSHSFLQGIFLTQGLNPGLLHCRWFSTVRATREVLVILCRGFDVEFERKTNFHQIMPACLGFWFFVGFAFGSFVRTMRLAAS